VISSKAIVAQTNFDLDANINHSAKTATSTLISSDYIKFPLDDSLDDQYVHISTSSQQQQQQVEHKIENRRLLTTSIPNLSASNLPPTQIRTPSGTSQRQKLQKFQK
jgi:hypothetical protein